MQDTVVNRALQRTANQQMAVWVTQTELLNGIKKSCEYLSAEAQESLFKKVLLEIADDKRFFEAEIQGRIGANQGVHQAIHSNKMSIMLQKGSQLLQANDGSLFYQILSGKISQLQFAFSEPNDFAQIGTHYYGSARCTILTTMLFCIWFTVTKHTADDISDQCGVMQKTNLPNDFGIPLDVQNRWLIRRGGDPDIVAIPHSGFAYGGHRPFPNIDTFDRKRLGKLISPFSPEDGSSFVCNVLPKPMLAPYEVDITPITTRDMQNGYRRHLLKLRDFPHKSKINAGQPSDTDKVPQFFDHCFEATSAPRRGDVLIINRYADTTSAEEDVVYGQNPKSGHCGIFYQGNQFLAATRDIDLDWEGIGLQTFRETANDGSQRVKVSYLRVLPKFNPDETDSVTPTFETFKQSFLSDYKLISDSRNFFKMDETVAARRRANAALAAKRVDLFNQIKRIPLENMIICTAPLKHLTETSTVEFFESSFDQSTQNGISGENFNSFMDTASSLGTASAKNGASVWQGWNPPDTIAADDQIFTLDISRIPIGCTKKAQVYKCFGDGGSTVAIKVAPCYDAAQQLAFNHEVAALQKFDHPHIVRFLGSEVINHFTYIVLEYIERSLRVMLEEGPIKPKTLVKFIKQLLMALDYLHSLGVVHKDVKPDNILLTAPGAIKLIDFDVSVSTNTLSPEQLPPNHAILKVTLPYVPPELKENVVVPAFDIWSAGITAAELATGKLPPYLHEPDEAILTAKTAKATAEAVLDGVDLVDKPTLSHFIHRCLVVDYKVRPKAAELMQHHFDC